MTYAWIIAGAAVGAPLRYFLQNRVHDITGLSVAWGTLVVNLSGCLVIGLLLAVAEERDALSREARLLLVAGFLGSYTTFSAFGWDAITLLREDDVARAAVYVFLSTFGGLAAVWAGILVVRTAIR